MASHAKPIDRLIEALTPVSRADDAAELLAVRGYRSGGTLNPDFKTGAFDVVRDYVPWVCSYLP